MLNVLATASEMTQLVASKGYESGVAGVRTVTPFCVDMADDDGIPNASVMWSEAEGPGQHHRATEAFR